MGSALGKLERLIGLNPKRPIHRTPEVRQYFKATDNVCAVYREYTSGRIDRPGILVYFISCPGNRIKIGYSVKPERRLRSLQTGMPFKLALLGYVPGGPTLEKMLRAHFAKRRVAGEWFKAMPALMREVETLIDLWGKRVSGVGNG